MKPKHSDILNARARLSLVFSGWVRIQNRVSLTFGSRGLLSPPLLHIRDVLDLYGHEAPDFIALCCAYVRSRAVMEMAISCALGDTVPSAVDTMVDAQIRELFGTATLRETEGVCAAYDTLWGPTTAWPVRTSPETSGIVVRPRLSVWERIVSYVWGS